MKEIVYLQKKYNNETILQIHVRLMPRFGIDAYSFTVYIDLDGWLKHQQQCQCET